MNQYRTFFTSLMTGLKGILTTKGDLLTFDTKEVRLAVGQNNEFLSAASAFAKGLDWKKIPIVGMANGTDGELITWDSDGVSTTVSVGLDGQVLESNGVGTEPTFQTPLLKFIVMKTTTETINNDSTLSDDSELTAPLLASKRYFVVCFLLHQTDTVPDFKYAFTLPTDATNRSGNGNWNSGVGESGTRDIESVVTTVSANTNQSGLVIYAWVKTDTTAGNITLQWAQGTSDAANTSVMEGATLMIYEVR